MSDALRLREAAESVADRAEHYLDSFRFEGAEAVDERKRLEDQLVLARAYLAANPPDGETPVTEEWVLSVGITKDLDVESFIHRFAEEAAAGKKTRSQFRALCEALGIPLREEPATA